MLEPQQEEAIKTFLDDLDKTDDPEVMVDLSRQFLAYAYSNQQWFLKACFDPFRLKRDKIKGKRPQRTYVVVDCMNMIHRAWTSKYDGKRDNFVKIIRDIKGTFPGNSFIIADDSSSTFRSEITDQWKGDREEKLPEFLTFIQECRDLCWDMGTPPMAWEGFECDDVMASIAATVSLWGDKTILETNDRDLWQCLGPNTTMHNLKTGTTDVAKLKKEYKITPQQAVDYWCLVGGKNGVKGCDGIGEVRASKLLEKYGSFQEIYHHREDLGSLKENLEEFIKKYAMLQRLHTLWNKLPIKHAFLEESA